MVDAVALPLFLDTTGTILATALAGPAVGIATGVVTSAVNTLRNPTFWPFVVVQIIVALYAWAARDGRGPLHSFTIHASHDQRSARLAEAAGSPPELVATLRDYAERRVTERTRALSWADNQV